MERQRAEQVETLETVTQMDPMTIESWPVTPLKANTPHVQELLRAVPPVLDSALVNPLKSLHVLLNYTEIVIIDGCDNQQYLYNCSSIYLSVFYLCY